MVKSPWGDHGDWSAIHEWAASIAGEVTTVPAAPDLMEIAPPTPCCALDVTTMAAGSSIVVGLPARRAAG
jgi:hypothetical protein